MALNEELHFKNRKFFYANKKITTNFINDIENGKKWVSPGTLAKLCEVLEIEPYKLFLEVDFEEKSSNKIINQFCSELSNDILIMLNEISNKYK